MKHTPKVKAIKKVMDKMAHGSSFQNKLRRGSQVTKSYLKEEKKDQGY